MGLTSFKKKLGDVIEMGARAAGGEKGARMVARERLKFAQGDLTDMPVPGMNLLSYLGIGGKPDKETGESLKRGQMLLEVEAKRERREEQKLRFAERSALALERAAERLNKERRSSKSGG